MPFGQHFMPYRNLFVARVGFDLTIPVALRRRMFQPLRATTMMSSHMDARVWHPSNARQAWYSITLARHVEIQVESPCVFLFHTNAANSFAITEVPWWGTSQSSPSRQWQQDAYGVYLVMRREIGLVSESDDTPRLNQIEFGVDCNIHESYSIERPFPKTH